MTGALTCILFKPLSIKLPCSLGTRELACAAFINHGQGSLAGGTLKKKSFISHEVTYIVYALYG